MSSNKQGMYSGRVIKPWPGPPAFASLFTMTEWCVVVDWVLKYDGGHFYRNAPSDGTTASINAAKLFGYKPSAGYSAIGGVFYNASIRPLCFFKG